MDFSADGREIVKLRGCVPAARMIAVLEHILSDPIPITYRDSLFDQLDVGSVGGSSALSEAVRSALERRYLATHDARRGGLLQADVAYPALDRARAFFCAQAGARCPCSRRATWTPWPPDLAGQPAPRARARGGRSRDTARHGREN